MSLHWQWIAGTTKKFFARTPKKSKLNYVLNALLFADVTLIIFTGIIISEIALPSLGIQFERNGFWTWLHRATAEWSVYLIGLHVALHWRWIVSVIKRLLIAPVLTRRTARPSPLRPPIMPRVFTAR